MAAQIAAKDEYRVKKATINQVLNVAKPNIQLMPNKIPQAVATPLPPLKP